MQKKKVLIIGAGIAGLSAGFYLARNGVLPPAALDGRNLTRKLCKRDNKKFVTFD